MTTVLWVHPTRARSPRVRPWGAPFTPRAEHARFCSAACRVAWNREHAGVAAAPAVAIDWSVTAMAEAAGRLATARAPGRPTSF